MKTNSPDSSSDREKTSPETSVEEEYPPKKVVIPALAAVYVVVFLFSLVCSALHHQINDID